MELVCTRPLDDFPHRLMPITLGVSRTNRVCYGVRDEKQTALDIAVASRMIPIHILFTTFRREADFPMRSLKGVAIQLFKILSYKGVL